MQQATTCIGHGPCVYAGRLVSIAENGCFRRLSPATEPLNPFQSRARILVLTTRAVAG